MSAAIQNFIQLNHTNKTIIFGDMFELGTESLNEHKKVVETLKEQNNITCYFIGNDFYTNKIEKNNFHFFDTFTGFTNSFTKQIPENGLILIKGSRGMTLERVLELL